MEKLRKIIITFLISILYLVSSIPYAISSDISVQTPFKMETSGTWVMRNSLWELGSTSTRISKIYVDDLDIITLLVGGTAPGTLDMNGNSIILDADSDTSMTADTDDQIDYEIAGADDFQMTANTFTALSGSAISTATLDTLSGSDLSILPNADQDVKLFESATSGENPYQYIYGYSTTHAGTKYGRMNVSAQGNMVIWGEVAGYLGAQGQSTYLFDNQGGAFIDDKRLRFGSDNDAIIAYDETTIDGLLFGIPVSSKRGLAFIDAANISTDITSLIGTTNFPDVHYIDTDSDSYLKVGWIADDEPEITANRTLDIQSDGDVDLNIFGKSGIGENAIFKIWGDESGTPTFFSVAVEASGNVDINAEGNLEIGGQGTQITNVTNKWIQMLDQRGVSFGSDSQGAARFLWDESDHGSGTNDALFLGVKDDSRGFIIGEHDISIGNGGNAYDLTGLLATDIFPKLTILDADHDSYMKFGWSADDTTEISVGGAASSFAIANNTAIGNSTDDVQPSFSIVADADSDAGGDTSETLQVVLTANADPTLATWGFTNTQSAGYTFDDNITSNATIQGSTLTDGTASITSGAISAVTTLGMGGDLTNYEAVNDANPEIRIGSADADEGHIQAVYDSGAQTLDYLLISTDSGGEGDIVLNPSSGFTGVGTLTPDSLFHIEAINDGGDIKQIIRNSSTTANSSTTIGFQTTTGDTDFGTIKVNRMDSSTGDMILTLRGAGTFSFEDNVAFDEPYGPGIPSELTIATGSVTGTKGFHIIDTQSDDATDDLDTIVSTNYNEGDTIILRTADNGRDVTIKDGTGNISLNASVDFEMLSTIMRIKLEKHSDGTWVEQWRSANT